MPTFNRPEFIRSTVESVFAQTSVEWELLIADDGSNDETQALLKTLTADERVRVLWREHTGSPGAVRNAAVTQSLAEYVAFLDSDDLWTENKLAIQLSSLRSRPQCGWSYTSFLLVDEFDEVIGGDNPRKWPAPCGWIAPELIGMSVPIPPSCVLMRRNVIAELGGFDERLPICNDYDLWLRVAMRYQVDGVQEPLVRKRRHHQHYGTDIGAFEELRRILQKLERSGIDRLQRAQVKQQYAVFAIGIARNLERSGRGLQALRALLLCDLQHWRYLQWWRGAANVLARVLTPPAVRRLVRRYRQSAQR